MSTGYSGIEIEEEKEPRSEQNKQTNSVAFSPQANYTD
jgi:hypothetical protein